MSIFTKARGRNVSESCNGKNMEFTQQTNVSMEQEKYDVSKKIFQKDERMNEPAKSDIRDHEADMSGEMNHDNTEDPISHVRSGRIRLKRKKEKNDSDSTVEAGVLLEEVGNDSVSRFDDQFSDFTRNTNEEQITRISTRARKPTARLIEMKELEKAPKRKRLDLKSEEVSVDSNEEEVIDVVTNIYDKRAKLTDKEPSNVEIRKMQGNRLKEYTETVESGRVDEDISTSSICNVKHIGPASEIAGDSSPSLSQEVMKKASTRANISNVIHPKIQQNRPIPAAAPLLTTDRTHTRIARRFKRERMSSESQQSHVKERYADRPQETSIRERKGESFRSDKSTISDSGKAGVSQGSQIFLRRKGFLSELDVNEIKQMKERHHIIIIENGEEVLYEPVDLNDEEILKQLERQDLLFDEGIEVIDQGTVAEETSQKIEGNRRISSSESIHKENAVLVKRESRSKVIEQDEEIPPELSPENGPGADEIMQLEQLERGSIHETEYIEGMGEVIRVNSPGGTEQFIQVSSGQTVDDVVFVDENGVVIEDSSHNDLRTVEFNFLDAKNICCGLCGEIVPYELLMNEHLPTHHPEVLGDNHNMDFDETPNVIWLRDKLSNERKHLESGFRSANSYDLPNFSRPNRILRKVSQYRVNPHEMSLDELDIALKKKMVEKMGRRVPVTLVDKQHARCGLCNAVVSLNRKFEVIHLVRHFNAWHPSAHRCAGTWKNKQPQAGLGKPLSMQDFAVIDTAVDNGDNLQCIWCGMFMSVEALAMHFSEVHPDDIEVPKCNLCLKELVINARLFEKYNEDFAVTLPDEHHIRCGKFNTTHTSESQFDKAIERRMRRIQSGGDIYTEDAEEDEVRAASSGPEAYLNSRMQFGRRSKPKRQFIMPALRQAAPVGSRFVEPVTDCHWKCKLCKSDILAAVISAGAIRHYRIVHPELLEEMQYELCKARLERVSDGCMEFVHPQLIECLVCNMTYMLHRPYNICRAIRHLKSKHPDMMPEYAGMKEFEKNSKEKKASKIKEESSVSKKQNSLDNAIDQNGFITDPGTIAMLKAQYNVEFEKVQALEGADGERVYVLMAEGEEIDPETANQLAESIGHIMVEENATEKQAVDLDEANKEKTTGKPPVPMKDDKEKKRFEQHRQLRRSARLH